MEDNQGGVWVSKEEYERLRQSEQQQGAAPVYHAGPTITAAGSVSAPDPKFAKTARQIRTISGIVAALSALLLFTGIADPEATMVFLGPIFGISFIMFLATSLALMFTSVKTSRTQLLRPRTVIGGVLIAILVIIAAPFLYGVLMVSLFFFMMLLGGGDVGS